MDYLKMAISDENIRREYQRILNNATSMRDFNINCAFEDGVRQKDIATALGLSESRVKKIIGELRKNNKVKL